MVTAAQEAGAWAVGPACLGSSPDSSGRSVTFSQVFNLSVPDVKRRWVTVRIKQVSIREALRKVLARRKCLYCC